MKHFRIQRHPLELFAKVTFRVTGKRREDRGSEEALMEKGEEQFHLPRFITGWGIVEYLT